MSWAADDAAARGRWTGPTRGYDLVKELVVALVVVTVLAVLLAAVFSSPDEQPITLAGWAKVAPKDFVSTALAELDGTSDTATYGPPYVRIPGAGQEIGPLNLQQLGGVRIPIDTAQDFVLGPLETVALHDSTLDAAIQRWRSASPDEQRAWADAFAKALGASRVVDGRIVDAATDEAITLPAGRPVPELMQQELNLAVSGGLEGAMLTRHAFYGTDYTQPLLFLADGGYIGSLADREAPARGPVGHDERSRQLPRTDLAVAVHALVPGAAVLHIGQRRRAGVGADDAAHGGVRAHPVHPGVALPATGARCLSADLARLLPVDLGRAWPPRGRGRIAWKGVRSMARDAVHFEEPRFARWLFVSSAAAWIWLVVRVYLGYEWAHAGWDKVSGTPSWLSSSAPLQGFVGSALSNAAQGPNSAVNYGWYAAFLRWVGGDGATIMSKVIPIGELTIGIALILGLFTGIAAFFAGLLTMSFGLAGVAGVNPVFFLLEVLLMLAWRNAGYLGLDRFVLPAVGTPWEPGPVLQRVRREPGRERQVT
jgi:uncharacterized membrane protein YphA (DoxX/SURF4 family)